MPLSVTFGSIRLSLAEKRHLLACYLPWAAAGVSTPARVALIPCLWLSPTPGKLWIPRQEVNVLPFLCSGSFVLPTQWAGKYPKCRAIDFCDCESAMHSFGMSTKVKLKTRSYDAKSSGAL